MKRGRVTAVSGSTAVAVAVLLSLGAVTGAEAATAVVCPRQGQALRPDADAEALKHLLSCLSEAARVLGGHEGHHGVLPNSAATVPVQFGPLIDLNPQAQAVLDYPDAAPALAALPPRLIDLPPPQQR